MASASDREMIITSIRKTQENFAVAVGVVITLMLCIYFFSYAQLADRGLSGALWFMAISTVLMVVALFRLKSVSFFLARVWLGRRPRYRDAFSTISASDDASS